MKRRILSLVLGSMIVACQGFAQNQAEVSSYNFSDSSALSKSTMRKAVVKLYPNPSYGKLSVSANTTETLHFYIFDLEGTLVYQAVLNNKDKKHIDNLKKGTYIYDVFEKDQSIEEGKIVIK